MLRQSALAKTNMQSHLPSVVVASVIVVGDSTSQPKLRVIQKSSVKSQQSIAFILFLQPSEPIEHICAPMPLNAGLHDTVLVRFGSQT